MEKIQERALRLLHKDFASYYAELLKNQAKPQQKYNVYDALH